MNLANIEDIETALDILDFRDPTLHSTLQKRKAEIYEKEENEAVSSKS